jgi:hypothetical protein
VQPPARVLPTPRGTEQHGLALALLEPADKFAAWGSWLGSLASASAVSQHHAAPELQAEPRSGAGAQARVGTRSALFRATRDQLGVAWSAEADPLFWQVVCWDSRDAAVARLKLSGRHRRATFAGLARLQQPFTIAVSGLGHDGSMVWQAGLADLYLRADRSAGREGASERMRTRDQQSTASRGRREPVSPKRPKKDPPPGKSGKTSKPKPKKKTARGK